ncbi:hypothetical protein PsalN5692_01415 [Piscirickettsia salmonis]|uniref:DUF3865 domain-containing protein n=3 Tax=Piscirickettsia salmonis TaxID=1238 RepID=UPI0012BA1994|nr:DUF3865 domain-containing protein [Piscirickettsia salmonis]QGP49958.1 hypothetical protein PsalN5692_01415 [Piscirickettsia salmonis]
MALYTTHYETLGINFHNITASRATSVLFNKMDTAFFKEVSYIVGTLYATEAKAIEELLMLRKIILSLSKGNLPSTMHAFLDEPINKWKITHLEGLNSSIYKYLSPEDYRLFRLGFTDMILGLNAWWMSITTETLAQQETVEA